MHKLYYNHYPILKEHKYVLLLSVHLNLIINYFTKNNNVLSEGPDKASHDYMLPFIFEKIVIENRCCGTFILNWEHSLITHNFFQKQLITNHRITLLQCKYVNRSHCEDQSNDF